MLNDWDLLHLKIGAICTSFATWDFTIAYSGEDERDSGVHRKSVRLRYRNSVHLAGGIAFTFPPECRSASLRNRVRMRPDSSTISVALLNLAKPGKLKNGWHDKTLSQKLRMIEVWTAECVTNQSVFKQIHRSLDHAKRLAGQRNRYIHDQWGIKDGVITLTRFNFGESTEIDIAATDLEAFNQELKAEVTRWVKFLIAVERRP